MVGAADPLEEARRTLWGAHLDDEVDVAPVDAEVEAGRCHQSAQLAGRHRRFDLAASLLRKAAVVDPDRQTLVVLRPQVLEDQLGEPARVAEYQGRLVLFDEIHDLAHGVTARMPTPWDFAFWDEYGEVGFRTGIADDDVDRFHVGVGSKPAAIGVGVANRRRQADAAKIGRNLLQAGHRQRQQIAALLLRETVKLIDDDRLQILEYE